MNNALRRYDRDPDGKFIIDVTADRTEDLYNDFDRSAPYIRRDLNEELVAYLIECAREFGPECFIIRFALAASPDASRQSRIRQSVNNFFVYLAELEQQQLLKMFRKALAFFALGIGILCFAVMLGGWLGEQRSMVENVLAEGITISAWVSVWEAVATLLLKWLPHRKNIKLYRRLAEVEMVFRACPDSGTQQAPTSGRQQQTP